MVLLVGSGGCLLRRVVGFFFCWKWSFLLVAGVVYFDVLLVSEFFLRC